MRFSLLLFLALVACGKKTVGVAPPGPAVPPVPVVTITSPAGSVTVTAASVEVTGNATVAGDVITSVSYQLNQQTPVPVSISAASSVAFDFTVTDLAAGVDTIVVTANTASASGESSALLVTYSVASQSFTPPVAADQTVQAITENVTHIVLTGASAEPNATLTYALVSSPSNGTLSGTPPVLTYRSNTGFVGGDSFSFTVNDGAQTSAEGTITINVTEGTVIYVDGTNGTDANSGKASDHAKQTLQAGIDAATGTYTTVSAAEGIYAEQLIVTSSVTLTGPSVNGALVAGSNEPQVVIQPPALTGAMPAHVFVIEVGDPTDAGATSPTLQLDNIKIDGSLIGPSITSCAPLFYEVALHTGANGKFNNDFFYYARLSDALIGCQTGIAVHSKYGNSDTENSLFTECGKQCLTVDGGVPANPGTDHVIVRGSQFFGTNPVSLGTQNSENAVVLWDDLVADVSNNTFENFGNSGPPKADMGMASVAHDYSTGVSVIITFSAPINPNNVNTSTGNTFTNCQGIFEDDSSYIGSPATAPIAPPQFVAHNTINGGYFVGGPFATGNSIFGVRDDDPNLLNFIIAWSGDWFQLSKFYDDGCTADNGNCIANMGPGSYCLTAPLFGLATIPGSYPPSPPAASPPPPTPPMVLTTTSGTATLSIPDAALPAGYTVESSITLTFNNGGVCP